MMHLIVIILELWRLATVSFGFPLYFPQVFLYNLLITLCINYVLLLILNTGILS